MATITTSNGNTTLTLEYTTATAKMVAFIDDALTYKYETGYAFPADQTEGEDPVFTLVDDMTNTQKAELVEEVCKQFVLDMAKAGHVNAARETAVDTAKTEIATRYE